MSALLRAYLNLVGAFGLPLFRMTTAHRRIEQLIKGARVGGSFIRRGNINCLNFLSPVRICNAR